MNVPRALHSACATSDGKIYVAGGLNGDKHALAIVERFDPETNIWNELAVRLTPPRLGFALVELRYR